MIFLDTNIFMYAAGPSSPQKKPSQQYLLQVLEESHGFCTSAEVLQEILYRYSAIGAIEFGYQVFETVIGVNIPILPVTEQDVLRAKNLLSQYPKLSARDAVHLGVMQSHGVDAIASYDKGFSRVPWVKRVEPA